MRDGCTQYRSFDDALHQTCVAHRFGVASDPSRTTSPRATSASTEPGGAVVQSRACPAQPPRRRGADRQSGSLGPCTHACRTHSVVPVDDCRRRSTTPSASLRRRTPAVRRRVPFHMRTRRRGDNWSRSNRLSSALPRHAQGLRAATCVRITEPTPAPGDPDVVRTVHAAARRPCPVDRHDAPLPTGPAGPRSVRTAASSCASDSRGRSAQRLRPAAHTHQVDRVNAAHEPVFSSRGRSRRASHRRVPVGSDRVLNVETIAKQTSVGGHFAKCGSRTRDWQRWLDRSTSGRASMFRLCGAKK